MSMPLRRKIVQVGSSKAVILPKKWIQELEIKNNCKLKKVNMYVNKKIIINPIIETKTTDVLEKNRSKKTSLPKNNDSLRREDAK